MQKITPVLMAGGLGTRLWPVSRRSLPKQFSSFLGGSSLYQRTAKRFDGKNSNLFTDPLVMTAEHLRFLADEQLKGVNITAKSIILEPVQKSTAPTLLAASILAMKENPDAILIALPTDHELEDISEFLAAIELGCSYVEQGSIVTFGIKPDSPHTGYGYLRKNKQLSPKSFTISQFVEKPAIKAAEQMLQSKDFVWNSGMFLFKARDMYQAFEKYHAADIKFVEDAIEFSTHDLNFTRLHNESWSKCTETSIDYAIMENASDIVGIELDGFWSDMGDWCSVGGAMGVDQQGNSQSENTLLKDCENVIVRSENEDLFVAAVGLRDAVVVATKDAVLVANKAETVKVSSIVKELVDANVPQSSQTLKDYRPWGWFESLVLSDRFQVKRLHVYPGEAPSLQSHNHRSEHWVVVEGTAIVTIGDESKLLTENQSIYIPLGEKHRIENPGKVPVVLIEIQTGSYLGEDDIIRYDDKYARC